MKRIQRKNYLEKLPANTKLVARPSRWGNPYTLKFHSLKDSLILYEQWLKFEIEANLDFLEPLKGFHLACYCPLDRDCHADILLKYLKR